MNHLLEISQLSAKQVEMLIERALHFKNNLIYPQFPQFPVANLFYENSTRTRVSFELAANKLAMPVVNLDRNTSSENKGEIIEDTLKTLAAMGVAIFVVRHQQEGLPQALSMHCDDTMHVINAGDGIHAHPSQALLDLMTIVEEKENLKQLKIAIVGNIRHSRVANSLQSICALLGVGELTLVAPQIWQPISPLYGEVTTSLQEGIANADVIICLRVQQERLLENEQFSLATYRRDYALTQTALAYAKPDVMVMHPGPINRGVEIDNEVVFGPHSFIVQHVNNGVFMRAAILAALIE
jgi:aspartate carbamoyltransferase catalytic subunit